ncbi:MAG: zinc metallopeptidase [Phototrophicaceae bacterium]
MPLFFDTNYLFLVVIPGVLLTLGAQAFLMMTYGHWSKVRNQRGLSGFEVGDYLVRNVRLGPVTFEGTPGHLSDHYDPTSHTVRMSQDIASTPSVAALAITAHELGHAEQHVENSPLIALRSFLIPAMSFSPSIAAGLFFAGLLFNATGLIQLGVLFFGVVVGFMILTLPVEIDASVRAMKMLDATGLLVTPEERNGARAVLIAAALTYVAAAIQSLLELVYYLGLANRD